MKKYNVTGIILAGGIGSRMSSNVTKQLIELRGQTVLLRSALAFDNCSDIDRIIVVAREEESEYISSELKTNINKPFLVVTGGKTRAESAINGFMADELQSEYVAIHDAARCLITPGQISSVVAAAKEFGAASAVTGVTDTLKMADDEMFISATLPRAKVYRAQTPQVFKSDTYSRAISSFDRELSVLTDDNMLVEALGEKIRCVDIGPLNIKITTMDDILLADAILKKRG